MSNKADSPQTPEKGRISALQFALLNTTLIIATADVFLPAFVAQEAKQDSWIAVIIGTVTAGVIINILITLGLKYPDKTLTEYSCDILGKPLGRVIGMLYAYFFLFLSYGAVRELAEIFVISFNPTAPDSFYSISTIIVAAYAVKKGLEVIARVNQILLPFGIIVLFFIAAINISKIDLSNFLPILYNGIFPSIRGALLINAWITESVILLQILPYVRDKEKIRLYTNISVLVLGGSLLAGVLTIAVLGVTVTERMLFPALQYIKIASIGPQITNLDLSIMVVWISGIFIKISTTYYAGVLSISQIFGLKTYKNMIIPFGLLIIAFSIYTYKNVSDLIHDLHYIFPFLMLLVAFVIPSILLAVSFIRKPPLGDEKQQADNVSNQNSARKDA